MNCGLFFAPIFYLIVLKSKLLEIPYANVSNNYVLQRTLTVIRLAIIIYENLRNSAVFF